MENIRKFLIQNCINYLKLTLNEWVESLRGIIKRTCGSAWRITNGKGKFKLDVKTLNNNQKTTSFYSDNAEPFVKHYKFIKGFENGGCLIVRPRRSAVTRT